MPERAKSLKEVFVNNSVNESIIRLFISAGGLSAMEYVSGRTANSFREMMIVGLVFGLEPLRNSVEYVRFDLNEPREGNRTRKFLKDLENNIFEEPRKPTTLKK